MAIKIVNFINFHNLFSTNRQKSAVRRFYNDQDNHGCDALFVCMGEFLIRIRGLPGGRRKQHG